MAARYEADALALRNKESPLIVEQARNIEHFLDLCDIVLRVFTQVVSTAQHAERFHDKLLPDVVQQIHSAVEGRYKKSTVLSLNSMPVAIEGYSGEYITALLLPLLENAVEASAPGGQINIEQQDSPEFYVICITNKVSIELLETAFPDNGASSKHEGPGVGLPVARRLVQMQREGKIDIELLDDVVSVRVCLPKGVK